MKIQVTVVINLLRRYRKELMSDKADEEVASLN